MTLTESIENVQAEIKALDIKTNDEYQNIMNRLKIEAKNDYLKVLKRYKYVEESTQLPNKKQKRDDYIIPEKAQNKLIKYWTELKKFYPRDLANANIVVNNVVQTRAFFRYIISLENTIPPQAYSDLLNTVKLLNEVQICCNHTIYKKYLWFLDSNFANVINIKKDYEYLSLYDQEIVDEIMDKIKTKYRNRLIKKILTLGFLG